VHIVEGQVPEVLYRTTTAGQLQQNTYRTATTEQLLKTTTTLKVNNYYTQGHRTSNTTPNNHIEVIIRSNRKSTSRLPVQSRTPNRTGQNSRVRTFYSRSSLSRSRIDAPPWETVFLPTRETTRIMAATLHRVTLNRTTVKRRQFIARRFIGRMNEIAQTQ